MIRSRKVALGALGAGMLVLTGCGHSPGAAFQIGDDVTTTSTVDHVVDAQCRLGESSPVARSSVVWNTVNILLTSRMQIGYGDSIGASYDGSTLRQQMSGIDESLAKLPSTERSALRQAVEDSIKGQLIAVSVGQKAIGSTSQSDTQKALDAGTAKAEAWAKKQGLHIDPRYSVSKSKAGGGDGSVSVPVTSFAKSAAKGSQSQAFVSSLPQGLRCGG